MIDTENKKEKAALNDELLDKVSGGVDRDYTCAWNPYGQEHEWVTGKNGKLTCIYCGVYID